MKKNQNGFSAVESLLLLVIVVIIGFTGWYVWHAKQNTDRLLTGTNSSVTGLKAKKQSSKAVKPPTTSINKKYPKVAIPSDCNNFVLDTNGSASSSYEAFKSGIQGEWIGCVTTPWTLTYKVSLEFRSDGSYSSKVLQDGIDHSALYYGMDQDSPIKQYSVDDLQDNGRARGNIVVFFGDNNRSVTDRFDDMSLTGNTLSFSFMHLGDYGPVSYKLVRVNQE